MIGIKHVPKRRVGTILSKNPIRPWNSTSRPIVVGHVSDIHLNVRVGETTNKLTQALNQLSELAADVVVLSGDLVDNKKDDYTLGDQYEPDWQFYAKCLNAATTKYKVLDITGNHDEYGLATFSSKRHYILNYSRYFGEHAGMTLKEFWVMKHAMEVDGQVLEIVSINPMKYPTPHAKFGYYIWPTREMLDTIEAELANKTNADFRILQCHFPLDLWTSLVRSSSGRTIVDMLHLGDVGIVVTGHTHPREPWLLHSQGKLEVVAVDLRYHGGYGLITIDNGRYVYHGARVKDPPAAVVTHPIPKAQLSSDSVFNEESTEIRVLVFSDKIRHISVEGDVTGTMDCDGGSGMRLCKLPMNLSRSNNTRRIKFTGDWTHEMEFVLGDSASLEDEVVYETPNYVVTTYVGLALLWVVLVTINAPFRPPNFAMSAQRWIMGQDGQSYWLVCAFLGPLVMKARISMLTMAPRLVLLVATLWPACLPLMFISIEGSFGIVWTWGYVVAKKVCFEYWGPAFALFYLLSVVCPATVFASGLAMWNSCRWPLLWNVLVYCVGLAMSAFINWYLIVEAVDVMGAVTSPGYVVIPICIFIVFVVASIRIVKHEEHTVQLVSTPLLE